MGRPVKLSDRGKAWCNHESRAMKRAVRISAARERILIVCEGTKTEPNYFRAFKALLPNHVVELDIQGEGFNTLSLVEQAQKLRMDRASGDYPFDQVWVVFDRDSFEPDNFDNAIHKATTDKIECAWSNEAFELWYILHFEYRTTGMSRDEYEGKLTGLLGQEYRKNATDMYRQLAAKGNQKQAIAWARRLHDEIEVAGTPASRANPCTTVFKLVETLNGFKPVQKEEGNT